MSKNKQMDKKVRSITIDNKTYKIIAVDGCTVPDSTTEICNQPEYKQKERNCAEPVAFTKANVKASTRTILNKIAADHGIFVYDLIDDMLKKVYPEYYQHDTSVNHPHRNAIEETENHTNE